MTRQDWPLKFGTFISPIHPAGENPTLALSRDVELIKHLDRLGFDEAWVGEHHTSGWEFISAPEVFLAFVAAQTRHIRLGTGVVSVPYHHPFMVAERLVLLDHLTRGRVMFGAGPGALPYDMAMFGIEPQDTRPMMEESLEAILALLAGERITRKTSWFELNEAALQLLPYSKPRFEIAVTASHSPAGARLSGMLGTSMLSLNATQTAGLTVLGDHWRVAEEQAAQHGRTVDRRNWRLVGPMHIAETEEQAREEVRYGLPKWCHYMRHVSALSLLPDAGSVDEYIDVMTGGGFAVIGTPAQAIEQIQRLEESSGGFGTFLTWAHDWANPQATHRSFELFAREVMPAFQDSSNSLIASEQSAISARDEGFAKIKLAREIAVQDYKNRQSAAPIASD
jgi:limonene 1,2-monooxygenase